MAVYKDKLRGTWYCVFYINGKQTTRRGFRTKREAQQVEFGSPDAEVIVERARKVTLDKVAMEYIKDLELNHSSSAYSAESLYTLHIRVLLGSEAIEEIRMMDIRNLQMIMLDKTKICGGYYSNTTINHVTSLLKSILNYAVRYEYIDRNPCLSFNSLKIVRTHDSSKFWTDTQFQKAIKCENDFMWYCMLSVLYLTGMRKGEVRGLQWSDIDFNNDVITINRHVNDKIRMNSKKTKEEQKILSGRKNGGSHVVAMDNSVKKLLQMHYAGEKMKPGYSDNCYVFGFMKPVGQNSPKRHLDAIAEQAGVPRITIHGLRHSHVSYLISKGLNPYEIAERIGDTVEMVLNVYGHQFPNPQQNVVKALNDNIELIFR